MVHSIDLSYFFLQFRLITVANLCSFRDNFIYFYATHSVLKTFVFDRKTGQKSIKLFVKNCRLFLVEFYTFWWIVIFHRRLGGQTIRSQSSHTANNVKRSPTTLITCHRHIAQNNLSFQTTDAIMGQYICAMQYEYNSTALYPTSVLRQICIYQIIFTIKTFKKFLQ